MTHMTHFFAAWRERGGRYSEIHWFKPTGYPEDDWSEPACGEEVPDDQDNLEFFVPCEPTLTCPKCAQLNYVAQGLTPVS